VVGVGKVKELCMGQKLYFWMLLLIFLSLGFLIQINDANAMIAAEIEPGIIELSTTNTHGFLIKEVAEKKIKDQSWVYFCLSEKVSKKPLTKCFYGRKQDFGEVKRGLTLNGIQYGLKSRLENSKVNHGNSFLHQNAYFYPALILRPQS
jgi:hypothetical protein